MIWNTLKMIWWICASTILLAQVVAYQPYQMSSTYQQKSTVQDFAITHTDEMRLLCNTFRSAQYCWHDLQKQAFVFPNFVQLLDTWPEMDMIAAWDAELIEVQAKLSPADLLSEIRYDIDYRFGGGIDAVYLWVGEYIILTGNWAVLTYSLKWNFYTYRKYAYGVEFVLPGSDAEGMVTDTDTATDVGIAISLDQLPEQIHTDIASSLGRLITDAYIHQNAYQVMLDTGEILTYTYANNSYIRI